jgi:hypothetical protein
LAKKEGKLQKQFKHVISMKVFLVSFQAGLPRTTSGQLRDPWCLQIPYDLGHGSSLLRHRGVHTTQWPSISEEYGKAASPLYSCCPPKESIEGEVLLAIRITLCKFQDLGSIRNYTQE